MPTTRERAPPTPRPPTGSPSRAPLSVVVPSPHPSTVPPSCIPLPLPSPTSQIPRRRAASHPAPEPRSPPLLSLRRDRLRLRCEPAVRRRRRGIIAASPSAAVSSPTRTSTTSIPPKRRPHNPRQHTHENRPEPPPHPPRCLPRPAIHPTATKLPVPLLPRLRQQQPVVDATAPFEDIFVICRCEPLADDVRRAELEFGGEGGRARPLDVFGVVVGALVLAAEDGGLVVGAGRAVAG